MKKVTVLFMEEEAALAAAQAGQVDVAHTAASYWDLSLDGYSLFSVASVDNRGFNLPATKAEEKDGLLVGNDFTSDPAVRKAINIGINREEMIQNVLNGHGTPAYSVCDKMPWYNPGFRGELRPGSSRKTAGRGGMDCRHPTESGKKTESGRR